MQGANFLCKILQGGVEIMKFSEKMEEIEIIVARMEKEALPLEDALALFEQGVALIRECQSYLKEAKQRVTLLSEQEKEVAFTSLQNGGEENDE